MMPRKDETPPWHTYDGCYGCREADKINRRAEREHTMPDEPQHSSKTLWEMLLATGEPTIWAEMNAALTAIAQQHGLIEGKSKHSQYPHESGDFIVLGPGVFAAQDRSVLNWAGLNYVPQNDVSATEATLNALHDRLLKEAATVASLASLLHITATDETADDTTT